MNKFLIIVVFLFLSTGVYAVQPLDGNWYDPAESGRGASVEIQNGVLVLSLYGYKDDGSNGWWQGVGRETFPNSGVYEGGFAEFNGGQCVTCDYVAPVASESIGDFSMRFDTWTSATLTWAGGVNNYEYLDFGYGDPLDYVYGQWMIWGTIGSGSTGSAISESWMIFKDEFVSEQSGRRIVTGNLSGYSGSDRLVVADYFQDSELGLPMFSMLLDSSASFYRFYVVSLNKQKANGRVWVFLKDGGAPSGEGSLAVGANTFNKYEIDNIFSKGLAKSSSAALALNSQMRALSDKEAYESQEINGVDDVSVVNAFNNLKSAMEKVRLD